MENGTGRGLLSESEEGGVRRRQYLEGGLFNELYARMELPKFVVAPARVCEDLDAVEAHKNVRATENDVITTNNANKLLTSQA